MRGAFFNAQQFKLFKAVQKSIQLEPLNVKQSSFQH